MTFCRSRGSLSRVHPNVPSPPGLSKPKNENRFPVWFRPRDGDDLDAGWVNPADAEPAPIEQKTNS